ncbi:MAG: tyrosine-type recombinase/integrase [Vicinamibacterales bacterium]|nr:tyrosine-type recombinase/integrase [Vicinamibacterales bacterium]
MDGRRFTARGIYRIVSELGKQAGTDVWPHGLRHTTITSAVEAAQDHGVTLDEVRQLSRHKNINTLLDYRDRVRDVQGQLASLVAGTVKEPARTVGLPRPPVGSKSEPGR